MYICVLELFCCFRPNPTISTRLYLLLIIIVEFTTNAKFIKTTHDRYVGLCPGTFAYHFFWVDEWKPFYMTAKISGEKAEVPFQK